MKNKLFALILAALLAVSLSSCSLAVEDSNTENAEDKFIGVYITKEHIDLFDFEGYLSDNLSSANGGNIEVKGNTDKYKGRIYATLKTVELTNDETGEKSTAQEYVFEEIEGLRFFTAVTTDEDGSKCTNAYLDEGISEGKTNIKSGEEADEMSLSGTIYSLPEFINKPFYVNSVYQSADGRVYLQSEAGISNRSDTPTEGETMSTRLEREITVTENKKTTKYKATAEISVATKFNVKEIKIIQFNADNEILEEISFAPAKAPKQLALNAGTEYILVETSKLTPENKTQTERQIYDKNDESIKFYCPRADGIFVENNIYFDKT